MSDPNDSTSTGDDAPLSPDFLAFCAKVRNNDPSIMPELGRPFEIRPLNENEDIELAAALLQNTNVTNLELYTAKYTNVSAEAMAKYVRTSKHMQCIHLDYIHQYRRDVLLFSTCTSRKHVAQGTTH
jgi:hypothetical protein